MWSGGVRIERRLVLLQGTLGGTSFAAETLAEALVIGTLGAGWMPVGLAGAALLSLGLTAGLARRPLGPRRLPGLAAVAVVIGVAVWGGLLLAPAIAAMIFLLVSRPLRDALTVAAGNVIAARYDPQAAKLVFPRLAATSQVGAIIVGFILPLVLRLGGPPAAVIAWPLLAGILGLVAWELPLIQGDSGAQSGTPPRSLHTVRRSPLLWCLTISAMLAVAIGAIFSLTAAMLLSAAIPDPARLASVYSVVGALSGIAILAVQVLGLPALLRRVGTARAALLPPTLALGVALWAVIGGLPAGIATQVSRLGLRPALYTPMEEILLGLLPMSERAAGRAWLRGGAVPVAGLVSSVGLAVLAALGATPRVLAALAASVAGGGFVTALILRRQHRQAALALARGGDLLAQRLALPAFGGVDAIVKEEITRRLETSARDDDRLLLVALLADLDRAAATNAVMHLLPRASAALTADLLAALAERRCPTGPLLPDAPRLLGAPDAMVRRAALAAFATTPLLDRTLVAPLLDDPAPEVAVLAVERLANGGTPEALEAQRRLRALVRSESTMVRASVTPLVAQFAPESLAALIQDASTTVRGAAVRSTTDQTALPEAVVVALLAATADNASSVRAAALAASARFGSRALPSLIAGLDDDVSTVRLAAVNALRAVSGRRDGTLKVPMLPESVWGRAAGLAILAGEHPWRWRQLLIHGESIGLHRVAQLASARVALGMARGPAGALLRRDLEDAIAQSMERWRECLIITEGDASARIIVDGLAAQNAVSVAQAQEALEAVRSPALARQAGAVFRLIRQIHMHEMDGPYTGDAIVTTYHTAMEDVLIAEASSWRRVLLAAAIREEPDLSIRDRTPNDTHGKGKEGMMLSLVERAMLLRGVPPFADLPSEQLRLLAAVAEEVEAPAGQALIVGGAHGDHLYVVVSGQIALEEKRGAAGSVARVATLAPGSALGEDAVFDGGAHVLSATAVTDCRLLSLRREVLLTLIEEQPALARSLITWLSARLRETTGKLAERTRARPRSVVDLLDKMDDRRR